MPEAVPQNPPAGRRPTNLELSDVLSPTNPIAKILVEPGLFFTFIAFSSLFLSTLVENNDLYFWGLTQEDTQAVKDVAVTYGLIPLGSVVLGNIIESFFPIKKAAAPAVRQPESNPMAVPAVH